PDGNAALDLNRIVRDRNAAFRAAVPLDRHDDGAIRAVRLVRPAEEARVELDAEITDGAVLVQDELASRRIIHDELLTTIEFAEGADQDRELDGQRVAAHLESAAAAG